MLDLNIIRNNPDAIKKNNEIRGCTISVDEVLKLDKERRTIIAHIDEMRAQMNAVTSNGKPTPEEMSNMKTLKEKIKVGEHDRKGIESSLNDLLVHLPNITHESVPVGKDESENVVYKKWSLNDPKEGSIPDFGFAIKPHWKIGETLDLIDEERGSKVSGARFWYLKNELVYLEFALVQYALTFLKERGFTPLLPPMIVRERALYGSGFFPTDASEVYRIANPEEGDKSEETKAEEGSIPSWGNPTQYLIGTAEVPLAAYHSDETIDVSEPLKYCAFSSCFRREAGTYGKDMKGILRGHQFDKIEIFVFCSEEESWSMHEYLQEIAEDFWQSLEIPYQVLLMCSGDIGAPNSKKYDIEAWIPGQATYREMGSCSNDTDFQARRLNIKHKNAAGKKVHIHTLNNTLCAMGRTMIAILENYQTKQGSIQIPEVLKPYMFGIEEIKK